MQILELDPVVEDVGSDTIESLHLVCAPCLAADPSAPALCGAEDEAWVEDKDYQNCVVCFDLLEVGVCPHGHLLSRRNQ